jgi:hypothetical protein
MVSRNASARIEPRLEATSRVLKLDVDSYLFEWKKLMLIFNMKYVADQLGVEFKLKEKNGGYHVFVKTESGQMLRRALGDDPKRIRSSEIRKEYGLPNSDTLFEWKANFRVEKQKSKIKVIMKSPIPYEECSLDTVLALPFWSRGSP